jgi:hypothetical protein
MQNDGAMSFATETVPSTFGIGFNQYGDRPIEMPSKIKVGVKSYQLSKTHIEKLQNAADEKLEKKIKEAESLPDWDKLTRPEKQEIKTFIKRTIRKELLDDFMKKPENKRAYPEETPIEKRKRMDEEKAEKERNKKFK